MRQQAGEPFAARGAGPVIGGSVRHELQMKLDMLVRQRLEFQVEIAQRPKGDKVTAEMQKHLPVLDEQIKLAEFELSRLDRPVAEIATTSVPSIPEIPPIPHLPNEYVMLGVLFMLVAVLPISLAFARRIWRRGDAEHPALSSAVDQRLHNMQNAIDSVAMEVERIGEGQRYVTGLLSASRESAPQEARVQMPEAVAKREAYRAVTPH